MRRSPRYLAEFALLAGLFLLFFLHHAHAGESIRYASDKECWFIGAIEKKDLGGFQRMLDKGCDVLRLTSPGGDVETAMAMGKAVRAKELAVTVASSPDKTTACRSACVFIYAGGILRMAFGPVEIHQPYLGASNASFQETQRVYENMERKIKAYLRSMNVKEELFDMMMRIPPEKSKALDLETMERLGMGQRDPVYEEYVANRKAAKFGFTKTEWLRRKQVATRECGDVDVILMPDNADRIMGCWTRVFPEYMAPFP